MTDRYPVTDNTRLHRLPKRGSFDRATVHAILDEALIAHVGFTGATGMPVVLPTAIARRDDAVIVHGSAVGRMMKSLAAGVPLCLTATLLDGLVLAKSAFHHSMNYRSVTVFGTARQLTDAGEKQAALRALTERLTPGRWDRLRPVTAKEIGATIVLELPIEEAVAKIRSGPPIDDAEDADWPIFAGVVPLRLAEGEAIPA